METTRAVKRDGEAVVALAEPGAVAGEGQHQTWRALAAHTRRTVAGLRRSRTAAAFLGAAVHHADRQQRTYNCDEVIILILNTSKLLIIPVLFNELISVEQLTNQSKETLIIVLRQIVVKKHLTELNVRKIILF